MNHPEEPFDTGEPATGESATGEPFEGDAAGSEAGEFGEGDAPQIFTEADSPAGAAASNPQSELDEANERVLRAQAELENYRKRVRREMEQERLFAASPVITDLLEVGDNMQLALQAGAAGGSEGLLQGVQMVAGQLASVLEKHGCQRIAAVGCEFDPNLHEAVSQEPSDEHPEGTVSRETRTGYTLHGRVLRPSQVFVSTGPASS